MSRKLIIHHSPACSRLRPRPTSQGEVVAGGQQPMAGRSFIIRESRGFTLVELLASIVVLVAIGSIIAGIISSSLRGSNKTNIIENIRQNGNYALSQISKDIMYAQPFDGKNTGLGNLDEENVIYETSCPYSSSPTPAPVETTYNFITVQSADNIVTKYNCSDSTLSAEGIAPIKPKTLLIDTASVSLLSCSFTCTQTKATDIPIIKINFRIGPKNSNNLVENSNPPITFETSVIMRNYKR